jgi:hypothetical protein
MDAHDLTASQATAMYEKIRPMLHYLASLERRMEERQFYADDRLYLEVKTARNAMQLLAKDLHRIACGPSYGREKN